MLTGLERANLAERARMVGRLAAVAVSISLVACVMRSPVAPTAPAAREAATSAATATPAVTATPAPVATPAAATPAPADCTLRILVSFAESGVRTPPEPGLLQDISHTARVDLTYVRSLTPELHLFVLRAADSGDPDCERALGRLRSDPRVRSADIDARRQPQR